MTSNSLPSLKGHWLWGNLQDFNADSLSFIESAAQCGDLVRLRFGPLRGYFVNHPDHVCKVLAARSKSFRKPAVVQRALSDILGENIFTSNGAAWKRSRQALQPAFHLRHVERYTRIMQVCIERELRSWRAGEVIDLEAAMSRVTMHIIVKTMFDADLGERADELTAIFTRLFHLAHQRMKRYALVPNWLPTRGNREVKRLSGRIRDLLRGYIADWRAGRAGEASLLNLVLGPTDGAKMSDEQLINEAITIIGAGFETTAYTLVFTWLALMQNPAVYDRLNAEVDAVLCRRTLRLDDVKALAYTGRVFKEALRLYPSAWGLVPLHTGAGGDRGPSSCRATAPCWFRPGPWGGIRAGIRTRCALTRTATCAKTPAISRITPTSHWVGAGAPAWAATSLCWRRS